MITLSEKRNFDVIKSGRPIVCYRCAGQCWTDRPSLITLQWLNSAKGPHLIADGPNGRELSTDAHHGWAVLRTTGERRPGIGVSRELLGAMRTAHHHDMVEQSGTARVHNGGLLQEIQDESKIFIKNKIK